MTEQTLHMVRNHEVEAYERIGWQRLDALDGTHHAQWSCLMLWTGTGDPVKPFKIVSHETIDEEHDHIAGAVASLEGRAVA